MQNSANGDWKWAENVSSDDVNSCLLMEPLCIRQLEGYRLKKKMSPSDKNIFFYLLQHRQQNKQFYLCIFRGWFVFGPR